MQRPLNPSSASLILQPQPTKSSLARPAISIFAGAVASTVATSIIHRNDLNILEFVPIFVGATCAIITAVILSRCNIFCCLPTIQMPV